MLPPLLASLRVPRRQLRCTVACYISAYARAEHLLSIVHSSWVAAVVVFDAFGDNPFSKVRLEAIDANIQQIRQVALPPFLGIGIGEVDGSTSRLPNIGLECPTIRPLYEISPLISFDKQSRRLSDPWVDPDADFDASLV